MNLSPRSGSKAFSTNPGRARDGLRKRSSKGVERITVIRDASACPTGARLYAKAWSRHKVYLLRANTKMDGSQIFIDMHKRRGAPFSVEQFAIGLARLQYGGRSGICGCLISRVRASDRAGNDRSNTHVDPRLCFPTRVSYLSRFTSRTWTRHSASMRSARESMKASPRRLPRSMSRAD